MERLQAQIRQVLAVEREEDSEDDATYEMEEENVSIDRATALANMDID